MTRQLETDVLALEFDGAQFEAGIRSALNGVSALKASMNFEQATRNLANLDLSARGIDFSPMADGIAAIVGRLSLMGQVAHVVIDRITNAVIDSAKNLFNTTVMAPMRTGMQEYETQMSSIQTILANTSSKGTVLEDVNKALLELNNYADKTIYNFTQMTSSIGKFTAAGIDLETSVVAIKGISNLAAVSGSDAQQASTAMYQLSQAMASGTVKLQDWNSVVNAGMGGEVFQNALIQTAKVHGVAIDQIIKQDGGFRGSLQRGWITTDILLETLSKFTGDLTEQQILSMGYTQEQTAEILKMAETANDAATKIKTLSQLKGTLAEAMQSGWSQTWAIIFGDFEEAKTMWGEIGDVFGSLISESADARNSLLSGWEELGGRRAMIAAFMHAIEGLIRMVKIAKGVFAEIFPPTTSEQLAAWTRDILYFVDSFKMGLGPTEKFKSIIRGIASVLDIFRMLVVAVAKPFLDYIKTLGDGAASLFDLAAASGDYLTALRDKIETMDLFGYIIGKVIHDVKAFIGAIKNMAAEFMTLDVMQDIVGYFKDLTKDGYVALLTRMANGVLSLGVGIGKLFGFVANSSSMEPFMNGIKSFTWANIKDFLNEAYAKLPIFVEKLVAAKDAVIAFGQRLVAFKEHIAGLSGVQAFLGLMSRFDGSSTISFFDRFKAGLSSMIRAIPGALASARDWFVGILPSGESIGSVINKFMIGLTDILGNAFENLDTERLLNILKAVLTLGILNGIRTFFGGEGLGSMITEWLDFGKGVATTGLSTLDTIKSTLLTLQDTLVSYQNNIKADTLLKIAIAVGVLAASVVVLSLVDSDKLATAVVSMGILMAQLVATESVISKLDTVGLAKATAAIAVLAGSLVVLSIAVLILSTIKEDALVRSMMAIGVALAGLIVAVKLMSTNASSAISAAAAMLIMSVALTALSVAVLIFGKIPIDVLVQGLAGIGGVLFGLAVAIKAIDAKQMLLASVSIGAMSLSLIVMSGAILTMGSISWDTMTRGLIGIAATLLVLSLAALAMNGSLAGAAAMLIMSVALVAIAGALKVLSTVGAEGMLVTLVGIAGLFAILAVAGYALGPVVPVLFGVGAAMLLLGAGALAVGLGLSLAVAAMMSVGLGGAAVAASISLIGGAIISLIPIFVLAVTNGVILMIGALIGSSALLLSAAVTLIKVIVSAIVLTIPDIILGLAQLLTAMLEAVLTYAPDFISAALELLIAFMQGISDNIEQVVTLAVFIVTNFIDGLTASIPDLIDAAFVFILEFITALGNALEEYTPLLIAAAQKVVTALVDGMVTAIVDSAGKFIGSIATMATEAIDTIKRLWDEHSPSKVFYDIAANLVSGLVRGVVNNKDRFVSAMDEIADAAVVGMNRTVAIIARSMDDNISLQPTISLNTSAMRSRLLNAAISETIGSQGYSSRLLSTQPQVVPTTTATEPKPRIKFVQNNHSPKPLSTFDIYRSTRMATALLEGA